MQVPAFSPVEQPLAGFSDMDRKGHVILRPIRSRKNTKGEDVNHQVLSFRGFQKDGLWYGIPIGRNADGTYKFKRINIDGHHHYNLEIEQDAKEWHIVRNHPAICTDDTKMNPRMHIFMVQDIENDAEKAIKKTNNSIKAIEIINAPDMSDRKLRDIARLFAIDTVNNSSTVIKNMLYEKALTNPDAFLETMRDPEELDIKVIIKRALSVGLINLTPDKGYLLRNSIPLGPTEGSVVLSLRKDKQMLVLLDQESKQKDKFWQEEQPEEKPAAKSKSKKSEETQEEFEEA